MDRNLIPNVQFNVNDTIVEMHPVDLKSVANCMVVSSEFLTAVAAHDKPYVRELAASHMNTPQHVLLDMLKDESMIVHYAALENLQTPFEAVLISWHKKLPEGTVWDSPAVVERHSDLLNLLEQYNISEEESRSMPARWIVKLLEPV